MCPHLLWDASPGVTDPGIQPGMTGDSAPVSVTVVVRA